MCNRLSLLAVALFAASCSTRLNVAEGATVTCEDGLCPSGLICASGLCVAEDALDTVAPDLAGPVVVSPAVARAGLPIAFSMEVTEPLREAPRATLMLPSPASLPCVADGATRWVCTFTPTGAENDGLGGVFGLDVALEDQGGLVASKSNAATVRLDFAAPALFEVATALALVAPPQSAIQRVTRLGLDGTVRVSFTATEPLAEDPAVTTEPALPELVFAKVASAGASFVYEGVLDAGLGADVEVTVQVGLVDEAGNSASVSIGAPVALDVQAPPAAAVDAPGRVVYDRAPWGTDGGRPSWRIDGGDGAVEAGAWVIARSPLGAELARTQASGLGGFADLAWSGVDLPRVQLVVVDGAGNASAAARVRDGVWHATLAGKVPGSSLENPSSIVGTPIFSASRVQEPSRAREPSAEALAASAVRGGEPAVRARGAAEWVRRMPSTAPAPGYEQAEWAFDSDRGDVLLGAPGATQDAIYQWEPGSGAFQERLGGAGGPSGYSSPVLYLTRTGRLWVRSISSAVESVWEWDTVEQVWTETMVPAGSPRPSSWVGYAYDPVRNVVVAFGGQVPSGPLSDELWEWDVETHAWSNRTPQARPSSWPGGRQDPALTYDPERGVTVMWGGATSAGPLSDVWEWNGTVFNERTPASGGPGGRRGAALTYDPVRAVLYVFGGQAPGALDTANANDLWQLDCCDGAGRATWINRTPAASPPGRIAAALRYDAASDSFYLLGGYAWVAVGPTSWAGMPQNDVWRLDAARLTWSALSSAAVVPPRSYEARLAYDSVNDKLVHFGGRDITNSSLPPTNTVAEARAGVWTIVPTPTPAPAPRTGHDLVFDAARARVVMHGGVVGGAPQQDTWEWDALGHTWTDRTPAGTKPALRGFSRLAYDAQRNATWLVGSTGARQEVWEWTCCTSGKGAWTDHTPSSLPTSWPPHRYNFAAAFDSDRRVLVMYGGYDGAQFVDDLWEYDTVAGTFAKRSDGQTGAPTLYYPSAYYDTARARTVLLGYDGPGYEWDGASGTWSPPNALGVAPSDLDNVAVAYVPAEGRAWMVSAFASHRVWTRDGGGGGRPGLVWEVPLAAGSLAPSELTGLTAVVVGGGSGATSSAPTTEVLGVDLLVWDSVRSYWRALASGDGSADAPAEIIGEVSSGAEVRELLATARNRLTLAIIPASPNGRASSLGEVSLSYLELSVRYRAP